MHPRFVAQNHPDRPAAIIVETGEVRTFGEMEAAADRGAHLLRAHGLKQGDTVAVWLPNCLDYFDIFWAGQRTGLYMVPLSTALNADEAAYIIADSGSRLLITSADVKAAAELLGKLPAGVEKVYRVGDGFDDLTRWCDAIAGYPAEAIADEQGGTAMFYSSGTTGRQKGVRRPLDLTG